MAEGIEHAMQADELRQLGCELGQGYLFSRPKDSAGMEILLDSGGFAFDGTLRSHVRG